MPIDISTWTTSLESLIGGVLPRDTQVTDDPSEFFDGFFGEEAGYPVTLDPHPIWHRKGVVIYVPSAQTFTFAVESGRWKKASDKPCQRIIWISDTGILCEVDDFEGEVTEFFPVSSANAAAEYIELLCGNHPGRDSDLNEQTMPAEDVVAGSYVRFFRYPDDLSPTMDEMPWVSTRPLRELIRAHVDAEASWLGPFMSAFQQRQLRKKTRGEPGSAKTILFEDTDEKVSPAGLALRMIEHFGGDMDPLRQACLTASASLQDGDMLDERDEWRLQIHWLRYGNSERRILDVAVLPDKEVLPDFLSSEVNPAAYQAIANHVFGPFRGDSTGKSAAVLALPSVWGQRRRAFEAKSYRYAIDQASRQLGSFRTDRKTAGELRGLLGNRYLEVSELVRRMPAHDAEVDRARRPLPYFVEAPLIAWERASNDLKVQSGFMAFENLLRAVVFLGLTEVQACRKQWNNFTPPPDDVMARLRGNPALGDWGQCLHWLGNYAEMLPIFGVWIRTLGEHRTEIRELTQLRNKYAHPAAVLARTFLEDIIGRSERFLVHTVSELRRASGVRVTLPLSRRAVRRNGGVAYAFAGRDLCSPFDRFSDDRFELPEKDCAGVVEGEVLAISSGNRPQALSLHSFFRAKERESGRFELLIYQKAFDGTLGTFHAIDSEMQEQLPMPNSPLSFDS